MATTLSGPIHWRASINADELTANLQSLYTLITQSDERARSEYLKQDRYGWKVGTCLLTLITLVALSIILSQTVHLYTALISTGIVFPLFASISLGCRRSQVTKVHAEKVDNMHRAVSETAHNLRLFNGENSSLLGTHPDTKLKYIELAELVEKVEAVIPVYLDLSQDEINSLFSFVARDFKQPVLADLLEIKHKNILSDITSKLSQMKQNT